MKSTCKKFVIGVLLTTCVYWISCGKDKSVDSNGDVANTDFVAKESFSFKVHVDAHTRLRLEGISGSVAITGESGSDSVIITGEKRVGSESTDDAEEHLQLLDVSVQDLGNEIFVKTIQPEKTHGRSYVVDYTITLPKSLEVLAHNVNGTVTVDSLDNSISVSNVNGLIALEEIFGSTVVQLTNGEIESQVALPPDGTIDMSVVNGNIDLNIPVNTSAEFSANVTNGRISVSNLVLQNEVSSPTSHQGTLGQGEGTISLRTINGNVNVSGF
jgi:DUF4097 and DUF4098 domain-containing protein YvlB